MPPDAVDFRLWLLAKGWNPDTIHPREKDLLLACFEAEQGKIVLAPGPMKPAAPSIRASGRPALIMGGLEPVEWIKADKADGDGEKIPRCSMTAYTGVPMRLQGWYAPVVIDLGTLKARQSVPVLRDHDPSRVAGHTDKVEISAQRIRCGSVLSGQAEHTEEVTHLAKGGFPWQASVGAEPSMNASDTEFVPRGESAKVNGRVWDGPLYVARNADLREISIVPMGADGNTSATVAASIGGKPMKFKAWLRATKQREKASLTEAELTAFQAEWRAAYPERTAPITAPVALPVAAAVVPIAQPVTAATITAEMTVAIEASRRTAADELARTLGIGRICAAHPTLEIELDGADGKKIKVNLHEHAIRSGWTVQQTELEVLRSSRQSVSPHLHIPNEPLMSEAVLEAALLWRAGTDDRCRLDEDSYYFNRDGSRRVPEDIQRDQQADIEARYPDQVRQAAHTLFKGRISLHQLLAAGCALQGVRVPEVIRDNDDIQRILQASFRPGMRADGASTASIGNVLANVLNKYLLQGYRFVEMTWREICGMKPVKDFKPTKSINLLSDAVFKLVNRDGQLEHATLSDQAFANQADTYGRLLSLDRQTIINDDLSALTTVPILMGRGSGIAINEVFWKLFLNPGNADDSVAFFSASHSNSNLSTGAGSALSIAGLQAAELLFDKQVDPKGKPLGVEAAIMLVPPDLKVTGAEIFKAEYLVYGGTTAAKQPQKNVFGGKYAPKMSRYLSNSSFTGNSATAWYLLAEPGVYPVIECCFLNGQEQPTVQTAQADFDKLGISIRGFWDFGVSMQNFRGCVKSNGA